MKSFANTVIITTSSAALIFGGTVVPAQAATSLPAATQSAATFEHPVIANSDVLASATSVALVGSAERPSYLPADRVTSAAAAGRLVSLSQKALKLTTQAVPYQYGGGHGAVPAPVGSRVDCSGLIRTMYYDAFKADVGNGSGDSIVRRSGNFTQVAHPVVGDVALFGNGGSGPAYHAGIYIGNGPGGTPAIVAATQTGSNISIQEFGTRYWGGDLMGYWHYNGATAADSQTSTQAAKPAVKKVAKVYTAKGNLERTTSANGAVKVIGWTYDPAKPKSSNRFAVYVDGRLAYRGTANKSRSDIARNMGIGAAHGISVTIKAKPGRHKVVLVSGKAGNSTTKKATVESHSVVVKVRTKGQANIVKSGKSNLRVAGWTLDPQTPNTANRIVVKIDGKTKLDTKAIKTRTDVARILNVGTHHGFDRTIKVAPGKHRVRIIAVGNKSTSVSTELFNKVLTVKG